nr:unnamed protein product [Digitaria exilis]
MASSSTSSKGKGPVRDEDKELEWQAAMQLCSLGIAGSSTSAAATGAAAPKVSTKLADCVRSNDGIPCLPNKPLNIGESLFGLEGRLHAISPQHWKVEADSKSDKAKNDLQAIGSQQWKLEADFKSEEVMTKSEGSFKETEFKKPNMILNCPRCKSGNTKFCYFNNYNVNQPRHHCKNCRRYWTDGGIMRDVPEVSGRRYRNKQPANHPRATKPCDANGYVSDAISQHVLPSSAEENEAMTKSESEIVLSLSLSPPHNTKEQKNSANLVSLGSGNNKEGKSCLSSAVVSDSSENSMPEKKASNILGYGTSMKEPPPHTQSNPASSALMYPYTGSESNSAAITASTQFPSYGTLMENRLANLHAWLPPIMPGQGIHAPAVPFPQVLLSQNCVPSWPNGAWSTPWSGSSGTTLPSLPPNGVAGSGNGSLTLGKHPREANSQEEEEEEKTLWFPKALRITDPEEAAKSTIWKSLAIKPDERLFRKSTHSKDKNGKTPESPQAP